MRVEIEYIESDTMVLRKFKGDVAFTEILESWSYIVENKIIKEGIVGIINDFLEANMKLNLANLEEIIRFFKQHDEIFSRIYIAVVMDSPQNIVLPMMAEQKYPQFKIKAFSSIEAAKKWILKK